MKLAVLSCAAVLALAAPSAGAQPFDPYAPPPAPLPVAARTGQHVAPLRAAVVERFDRNHDGRLGPQERRQAIRALRRLARNLARQDRNMRKIERRGAARRHALEQRYDADGDGVVGPGELPPPVADKLRRKDRNRDGWVDDAELGR